MPKMKTHKGAAKRFKVTGSGRLRRRQSHRGHLRLAKGKDSYRRLKGRRTWPRVTRSGPSACSGCRRTGDGGRIWHE